MTSLKSGAPLPTFESFARPTHEAAGSLPLRVESADDRLFKSTLTSLKAFELQLANYAKALETAGGHLRDAKDNASLRVGGGIEISDVTLQAQLLATVDHPDAQGIPWKVQIVIDLRSSDADLLLEQTMAIVRDLSKGGFHGRNTNPYHEIRGNSARIFAPYH